MVSVAFANRFFDVIPARAAMPATIGYQGRLLDSDGDAQGGTFSFTFRIYADPTGGTALWTEAQSLSVSDGFVAARLGSVTPFPAALDFNRSLYVSIQVASDGEMSPRLPVNAVPYAFTSGGINALDAPPVSATGGRIYYDTTNGALRYYDGMSAAWVDVGSSSSATGSFQDVTDAGSETTHAIQFAGGTSTGAFAVLGPATFQAFSFSDGLGTNVTSTNVFSTNGTITNLASANVAFSGGTINGVTLGLGTPAAAIFTSATATTLFATNASFASLTVESFNPASLTWTDATGTNTFSTNLSASSLEADFATIGTLISDDVAFASGTSTGVFRFASASGSVVYVDTAFVAGQSVCLANGTNCPSSAAADFQTVTNVGASTMHAIQFAGGTSTGAFAITDDFTVTGTLALFGDAVLQDVAFASATGSRLFAADGVFTTLTVANPFSVAGLVWIDATGTNVTTTDLFASSIRASSAEITSASLAETLIGNASATAFSILTYARLPSDTRLDGELICLADGTNCQTVPEPDTLLSVANRGSVATATLSLYGGLVTSDLVATGTADFQTATFTNATGNRLFVTDGVMATLSSGSLSFTNGTSSGMFTFNNATGSGLSLETLLVSGQSVCLTNGTQCAPDAWRYDAATDAIFPSTSSADILIGAGSAAFAPFRFLTQSTSSRLFVGANGSSTDVVIGAVTSSIASPLFQLDGNDLFVAGNIGSASSVYSNGAFFALSGPSSTVYGGRIITTDNDELVFEQTGDELGATRFRLQSRFGSTGALFEQGSPDLDLVDFGFLIPSGQSDFRLEARTDSTLLGQGKEFQYLINATDPVTFIQFAVASSAAMFMVPLGIQTTSTPFALTVAGSVGPGTDALFDLGSATGSWRNGYITNVSSTSVTTTDLFAGTVTTSQLFVGGRKACLEDGTNCSIGQVVSASSTATTSIGGETEILSVSINPGFSTNMVSVGADIRANNTNILTASTVTVRVRRGGASCGAGTQVGVDRSISVPASGSLDLSTFVVDAPVASTAVTYRLCALGSGGTPNVSNRTMAAQVVRPGADLAEVYYSDDPSLVPGEVVVIDGAGDRVRRARPHDAKAIGVVSTRPGSLLAAPPVSGGIPVVIALAGRVPVRISLENGPIRAGDALTAAGMEGMAAKAIEPGQMIGRALSDYDAAAASSAGTVMMFVQHGYYVPAEGEEAAGGVSISSAAPSGSSFHIVDHASFQGDVTVAKHLYQGVDAAGFAKFLAGSREVRVRFSGPYLYPPVVNATPLGEIRTSFWVEDADETGFTLRLGDAIDDHDTEFGWAVTAVQEPVLFLSDGTSGLRAEEERWRTAGSIEAPSEMPPPEEPEPTEATTTMLIPE